MVAENKCQVLGVFVYELHKRHLQLLRLAVSPWSQNVGIGSEIIDKLKSKLRDHLRTAICLEVRETDLLAQLFFKRHGFVATDVVRDFYEDTGESAYVMEYRLNTEV